MDKQIENAVKQNNLLETQKNFWQGFYAGFTIVVITGLCDKLFFLNMIYASLNSFCNAFWVILAIAELMNLVNISLGELIKQYISLSTLEYIAIGVFILLAICLLYIGFKMPERQLIQNYEEERKLLNIRNDEDNEDNKIEEDKNKESSYKPIELVENIEEKKKKTIQVFDSWWEFFITYFLASFGGKSQIATILLTCKYNFVSIYNGSAFGIVALVLLAIIFGSLIARYLTNRQIYIVCGILFLFYALVFFFDKSAGKIVSLY